MASKVQLRRWGNSQGIRIPKEVIDFLNLPADAEFDLKINRDDKTIILQLNEGLTPYQRLIKQNHKAERTDFRWDRLGEELL
jgi:antitoxin MazE